MHAKYTDILKMVKNRDRMRLVRGSAAEWSQSFSSNEGMLRAPDFHYF
jgi:hypothetical protein